MRVVEFFVLSAVNQNRLCGHGACAIVCVSESTFRPKCVKSGKAFSRSPKQIPLQSPHQCRGKMRRSVAFVYERLETVLMFTKCEHMSIDINGL